ncbi:hypothetical protein EV385_1327 [Krasilnikovia cinnamomea]|uniref:Uncharacterized protein n=1 Tax=Krasilnikovia cinnamomea TaxID=349313 RepID=A0A4Q7ZGP8_9ACTN|nr:hypothetical protein [Krasilnikovia cinnamomea]RZU49574.1 hypothetical protein EV385_1327 [Krasilnikovia cinnamomea]
MSDYQGAELHKLVERYEVAFAELRAAQEAVRGILSERLLVERLRQLGESLGAPQSVETYGTAPQAGPLLGQPPTLGQPPERMPEMSESWAG